VKGQGMFRRMADRFNKAVGRPVARVLADPEFIDRPTYVPRGIARSWLGFSGGRADGAKQLRAWFGQDLKMVSTRDGKPV